MTALRPQSLPRGITLHRQLWDCRSIARKAVTEAQGCCYRLRELAQWWVTAAIGRKAASTRSRTPQVNCAWVLLTNPACSCYVPHENCPAIHTQGGNH